MVRISAIFIAVCMVLIAGSLGLVVYLRFGLTGAESALVALGVLTALGVYNAVSARTRDRSEVSDQIGILSRGTGDLARQVAEFGRRLGAMEGKVDQVLDKALAAAQPLAAEMEEISALVKQLADSVAAHDAMLSEVRFVEQPAPAPMVPIAAPEPAAVTAPIPASVPAPAAATAAAPVAVPQPAPAAPVESAVAAFKS